MTTSTLYHAWVVHKSWSGDTSARVVFFTKEQGLVSCFYKGGRLPKKQALLQLFTPLWLSINVRGDAYFVHQIELSAAPLQLESHSLFAGLYVNELIYHALKPHDTQEALHVAYSLTLNNLVTATGRSSLEPILRRFEYFLLNHCGYAMSFTHEALTGLPIMRDRYYQFRVGEGFFLAEKGILGDHLIALSQDKLENPAVLQVAKWIMRRAIKQAIDGKEIKSRAFYIKGES